MPSKPRWSKAKTLSGELCKRFEWSRDGMGHLRIRSSQGLVSPLFSKADYLAMLRHVGKHPKGVQLGSSRTGVVPAASLGNLMARRKGTDAVRGWCSHLAAIAVQEGLIAHKDLGRGPGRGIWLFPKGLGVSAQVSPPQEDATPARR